MTTIEMLTKKFDTIAKDAGYFVIDDEEEKKIHLTIEDFDGFDDDWCEIDREFEDPKAVDEVLDWLEENADRVVDDYYTEYYFDDVEVIVGYSSYDI